MRKRQIILIVLIISAAVSGCVRDNRELHLSTTTSTCDTGLLDALNKQFEAEHDVTVKTLCQGTGKAIATGELGAADVVLVHAPSSELAAVERGSFIDRTFVMYNYFVIIGPPADPANVSEAQTAADAFGRIAAARAPFFSRGDDSGTHKKEINIWNAAGISQTGEWYQSVGKGMGDTIITADIRDGYTLSDMGTYLAMKDQIDLVILLNNDTQFLYNPYHVMAVNPDEFPDVDYELAAEYMEFLTSDEVQDIIRDYGRDKYNQSLFIPARADIP